LVNVTTEELQRIRKTIGTAIEMHGRWLESLQRTFACRLSPAETDLAEDAHQRCDFGRWFYSRNNAGLRQLPAFVQVEELHTAMHKTVREICGKLKALGQVPVDDYDLLMGEVRRFRDALSDLNEKVEYTLQNVDPLTEAITSGRLLPDLRNEQKRLRESHLPYTLLLVDLDVKEINFSYGHETGDSVLRNGVATIKEELAGSGRIYRYSGAEFVVTLPGKTEEERPEHSRSSYCSGSRRAPARCSVKRGARLTSTTASSCSNRPPTSKN